MGFWKKTGEGLSKTRRLLSSGLENLFQKKKNAGASDADVFEQLEEILLGADLGVKVTMGLIEALKESASRKEVSDLTALKNHLQQSLIKVLEKVPPHQESSARPHVTLFIGVNGVGKTTTIGKRAKQLSSEGKTVLLAAADTFRAGAGEQLSIWGKRAGAEVIRHQAGADPSAVAYDAVSFALNRKIDHLLIDTAGRLQTQHNLMEELKKIRRVIAKQIPEAPHETILVLDATTGQNGLSQAEHFQKAIGLSSIILTKLDGTGRGGIVVPIVERYGLPITHIGLGEGIADLIPFEAKAFVSALFEADSGQAVGS